MHRFHLPIGLMIRNECHWLAIFSIKQKRWMNFLLLFSLDLLNKNILRIIFLSILSNENFQSWNAHRIAYQIDQMKRLKKRTTIYKCWIKVQMWTISLKSIPTSRFDSIHFWMCFFYRIANAISQFSITLDVLLNTFISLAFVRVYI